MTPITEITDEMIEEQIKKTQQGIERALRLSRICIALAGVLFVLSIISLVLSCVIVARNHC